MSHMLDQMQRYELELKTQNRANDLVLGFLDALGIRPEDVADEKFQKAFEYAYELADDEGY